MTQPAERLWRRPVSTRVRRILLSIAFGGVIVYEGWLGRKRLFVNHDSTYIFMFTLFASFQVILLFALEAVADKTRRVRDDANFGTLQMLVGVVSFLAAALLNVFDDYTTSTLSPGSVFSSVVTGLLLGVFNVANMKKPSLAENV